MRTASEALKEVPTENDVVILEAELKDIVNHSDIHDKDKRILKNDIHGVMNYYRRIHRLLKEASHAEEEGTHVICGNHGKDATEVNEEANDETNNRSS